MEPASKNLASPNTMRRDTSTRLCDSTESQLSKRIWLEVGHAYEPRRWKSSRAVPEDWCVWVRGVAGADIAAHVDKVVFQLCPDTQFPFPKRICIDAPYQLEEAGSAPTEILIDVHLNCNTKPEQFRLKYGSLFGKAEQRSSGSRYIFYDLQNPSDQPDEPADAVLSHKKMLLFESCDICDLKLSICPLLYQGPTKRNRIDIDNKLSQKKKLSEDGSPHIPSISVSKVYRRLNERYKKIMFRDSIKPNGSTRHSCLRCLTRVTPCPSCQPRRVAHRLTCMSKLTTS